MPAQPQHLSCSAFQGIMPTKEAFICSSTGTFLRLFPEQEFLWSKQGFLHFPVPIFRLAGAEPFPWHRTPSAMPCPVLGSSSAAVWAVFALMDGIRSLMHRGRHCPKPQLLVPALPCRRFELGTFYLKSRICPALKASPSHFLCAIMSV